MEMPELTVTSEIYGEYDYKTKITPSIAGNVISEFPFLLCKSKNKPIFDADDDLDVDRPQKEVIIIEHSSKTKIALVGLQVWRGAFLLGDLLIHLGLKGELKDKRVMELGAGTGLTSFVAAMYARKVICTDINVGGILDLIKLNAKCNAKLIKSQFKVMPLDFTETWSQPLTKEIEDVDVVIAADGEDNATINLGVDCTLSLLCGVNNQTTEDLLDSKFLISEDSGRSVLALPYLRPYLHLPSVIYDDDVTAAFVSTIQKILNTKPPKTLYVVLEKRYVFTIEHMDSVAPCYETFLTLLGKVKTENVHSIWTVEQLPLDFPKYFTYDRVKELVLWKIVSKPNLS